ncbi:MAG: hypothetical protein JW957_02310 [Candidatus Omnitrophica bacterium]|nr:hypothetical protein [Candidatus Omnitrophota bacterium]
MPIFSYRAVDKDGKTGNGLLRAGDYRQAVELLHTEGFSRAKVRLYCKPPNFMALAVFSIFFAFVIFGIVVIVAGKTSNIRSAREAVPPLLILLFVLAVLIVFFRIYLRQTLRERTKAYLDTGGENEAYLLGKEVRGEFIPEKEPRPVVVYENGVKKQKVLTGKLERFGLPNYLHMLICLSGYYLPAIALWASIPDTERRVTDSVIPAWGIALGLSLLVIPALFVTLALKFSRTVVITISTIAALLHFLLLRNAYIQRPESAAVYEIMSSHPVHTILAWVIPAGTMILLERNKRIKDLIRLEIPVYEE